MIGDLPRTRAADRDNAVYQIAVAHFGPNVGDAAG
jgi:hypothetical protein